MGGGYPIELLNTFIRSHLVHSHQGWSSPIHSKTFELPFFVLDGFVFLGQGLLAHLLIGRIRSIRHHLTIIPRMLIGIIITTTGGQAVLLQRLITIRRRQRSPSGPAHRRLGVDLGVESRSSTIVVVVLEQKLARLLVEGGLGIGHDEQALDGQEDVLDAQIGLPIAFERVHADLAFGGHVRVEDLGEEVAFRRTGREILAQHESDAEPPAGVRRVGRPFDQSLDGRDVLVVEEHAHAFQRVGVQRLDLLAQIAHHLRVQVLHVGHHLRAGQARSEKNGHSIERPEDGEQGHSAHNLKWCQGMRWID